MASEQKEIILSFQWPPIEKMDSSLAILTNVEFVILLRNYRNSLHECLSKINEAILSKHPQKTVFVDEYDREDKRYQHIKAFEDLVTQQKQY